MASTWVRSSTANDERWLHASGVCHRYGDRVALTGVHLELRAPRVAVVGRNGAGKSTLLSLCAGRLRATRGALTVLGVPAGQRTLSARIGHAAQRAELDPDMTGRELLRTFSALYGLRRSSRAEREDELVERFHLQDFASVRVGRYSGGMRRRLHLALSLLHEPSLWIVDEPEAGLDAEGQSALWQEVDARADRGQYTLFSAHQPRAVAQHADTVVALEGGAVARIASLHELASSAGGIEAALAAWTGGGEGGRAQGRPRG